VKVTIRGLDSGMSALPATEKAIYPLSYAARLAGLDEMTARRWMHGYGYKHKGETRQSAPVIQMISSSARSHSDLTFEELLTLRLVRAFREEAKLGLQTIKAAVKVASTKYNVENPFVTKAFRSDGRKVFLELRNKDEVRGEQRVLVEAMSGQQQFREVVEPSLFRNVVFVGDEPTEWRPTGMKRSVVIRPDRAFGAPHIDGTGVRTDVVYDAVVAEGKNREAVTAVADWFGVTRLQVIQAFAAEVEWRTPRKS
jgi:uncharacterized protein (DUF433 family)